MAHEQAEPYSRSSHINRHPIEDRSRCVSLPFRTTTGDEAYLLKALVAEDEDLLWAFLLDEWKDYEWVRKIPY